MNVKTITESINAIFKKVRGAAPAIPPMLMALGAPQRPGLSTIISTSNIVNMEYLQVQQKMVAKIKQLLLLLQ